MAFTDAQQQGLDAVLDVLIPPSPDGRLPGAGQLHLADTVAGLLAAMPPLPEMIERGLVELEAIAARRTGGAFAALPAGERSAALDELNGGEHGFPPVLALYAFAAYYQQPPVLAALGLEPRPPHPGGYQTVAGDLSLLAPVRQRGRIWRACS